MIRNINEAAAETPSKSKGAVLRWLVSRHDGASNFEMRLFTLKPGGTISKHMHPNIEHEQYVVRGSFTIGIGDEEREVKAGDAIFIQPGTPHWYVNRGTEDAEFICVVPKKQKYRTVFLE